MKLALRQILATAGLLSAIATPVVAEDFILSIGHDASSGSGSTVNVEAGDRFFIDLGANRSYSCEGIPTDPATDFDWDVFVAGTTGTPESISPRLAGGIVPQIGGETDGNANNRLTFTPTTTDRFILTVATAKVGGELVRVRCLATTMFGGYNTNVNDFNYLELTNIGNATLNGTITATNYDGTVAINAQPFSVAAQRRIDIDLHTAVGVDKFGFVRVTHDGPLGTLKGNISQYKGTVADFTLTHSAPLELFDQRP